MVGISLKDMEKGKKTKPFSFKISEEMHQEIISQAQGEYRKFNDQVRFLLQLGLEANKKGENFGASDPLPPNWTSHASVIAN